MPSSFTRILSSALGFSPCPPVSVWSTDNFNLMLRGFSWKHGINHFALVARIHASALNGNADFPTIPAYTLNPGRPSPGRSTLLRPPFAVEVGTGILTGFPSTTLMKPRLRVRLTLRGLASRRKLWAYGEQVSHLLYRYSCQHSHFRYLHRSSRYGFAGLRNAPLPRNLAVAIMHPHLRYKS